MIKEININEPMKNRLFITIGFLILIIMFFPFLDYNKISNIGFINVERIKQGKITNKLEKTRIFFVKVHIMNLTWCQHFFINFF